MDQNSIIFEHWGKDRISEIDKLWPIDGIEEFISIVITALEDDTPLALESMTEDMMSDYIYNKIHSGLKSYYQIRNNILKKEVPSVERYTQTMKARSYAMSCLKDLLVEIPGYLYDRERILEGNRINEFEDVDEFVDIRGAAEIMAGTMLGYGLDFPQINVADFYREYVNRIKKTIQDIDSLIPLLDEFLFISKKSSMSSNGRLWFISHEMRLSVNILQYIQSTSIPFDEDETLNDSLRKTKNLSREIAMRLVSAKVIINDITDMQKEKSEKFIQIHLFLAMLESLSESIISIRNELINFFEDVYQDYLGLMAPDNSASSDETEDYSYDEVYYDEEECIPDSIENYQVMKGYLMDALGVLSRYGSDRFGKFFDDIITYLVNFGKGIAPDKEFEFGIVLKDDCNIEYIEFNLESEIIEITHGGSILNEEVGHDSYTDWMYTISLNGIEDDEEIIDFQIILGIVSSGATIEIFRPDEYSGLEY